MFHSQYQGENENVWLQKIDKRIFLEYFEACKAYRIYNVRISIVKKVIHIRYNDHKLDKKIANV